jgi:hypothetical protein
MGLLIAVVVYVATAGHLIILPLLLFLPFGMLGRRRSTWRGRWH